MAKVNKSELPIDAFFVQDDEVETHTLSYKGTDTVWVMKRMTWFEKNKCVTKATLITPNLETGEMIFGFDLATYYLESLLVMLVEAPIPISMQTLKKLDESIGGRLQGFVPAPLETPVEDVAKKD